jgi:hypothetical protein
MNKTQPNIPLAYCLIMIVSLLWLTVSAPFIYEASKMVETQTEQTGSDNDESNPLAGATEERSETNSNTSSEYLNEHFHECWTFSSGREIFKCHSSDIYLAFRPELICPPPDQKI